jgi:pimeloyl-ACP methyl ester carboxylesterase
MPTQTKPSIVFCHGLWADGSCFSKVMPALQADGHEVIAVQYGLDSHAEDLATIKRTLGRVKSPAILVGHSYGGATITGAGTDDRVIGLVYIAAVAPAMSRSRTGGPGRCRQASSISREIFPRWSRSWCGRPITRRPRTYFSSRSSIARPGSRSRAGSPWRRTITRCIPIFSVSWRSGWERTPSRRIAVTSLCFLSPTSSLT